MPKLRRLSGSETLAILSKFGFQEYGRKGSHVKLRRVLPDGTKETLTVPLHQELDTGTLKAIVRQAQRFVSEAELRKHFYR